jgi:hypothetical protein
MDAEDTWAAYVSRSAFYRRNRMACAPSSSSTFHSNSPRTASINNKTMCFRHQGEASAKCTLSLIPRSPLALERSHAFHLILAKAVKS